MVTRARERTPDTGRKRRRATVLWHAAAIVLAAASLGVFWASRPTWDPEMRLWKAVGDASLVLLLVTMSIGPLGRLWRPARRLLGWRRELGIWFALVAAVHVVLILDGWARWTVLGFFGFEFVPQLGRVARMEPGFGLSNLIGAVAMVWALALAATSSDWAMRRLGPSAWKWLHNGAYVVFWAVVLHVAYFLYLHYTASFHKQIPPPDWFRLPFAVASGSVVALQLAAFVATVRTRRRKPPAGTRGGSRSESVPAGAQ